MANSSELQNVLDNILADKNRNLLPKNVKKGVKVLGVTGTLDGGIDTSDATAEAGDIIEGKTAYAQDQKITGTIPNNGSLTLTPSKIAQELPEGYISGGLLKAVDNTVDPNIIATNIKKDITILGVRGTLKEGTDTSDATATADDIASGKSAYVNGEKIDGRMVNNNPMGVSQNTSSSFYTLGDDEMVAISGDLGGVVNQYATPSTRISAAMKQTQLANDIGLTASKLKKNETILGVTGTLEEGIDTSDATATADDIISPKTAYIDGQKVTGTIESVYEYDPTQLIQDNITTNISNSGENALAVSYDREIVVDWNGTNIRVFKLNKALNTYENVHNYTKSDLGITLSIIKEIKISKLEVEDDFYRIGFMTVSALNNGSANQVVILNFLKKSTGELNVLPTGYSALSTTSHVISWGSGGFAFSNNNPNYVTTICREHYSDSNGWSRLYTYLLDTNTITLYDSSTGNGIPRKEQMVDIEYCGNDNYIRLVPSVPSGDSTVLLALDKYKFLFDAYNGNIIVNNEGNMCIKYGGATTTLYSMTNDLSAITLTELATFNISLPKVCYWGENDIIYNLASDSSLKTYQLNITNYTLTLLHTYTAKLGARGINGTPTYFNFNIKGFNCKTNSNILQLYSYKFNSAGTLVGLIKNNITFKNTQDANALNGEILQNKYAYVKGVKLKGTMPNNGTLNYVPSTSQQIIPEGYTSGGTVGAIDITTTQEYQNCLDIADDILGGIPYLPYTELEYIESTGTQWINTGIHPSSNVSMKTKFSIAQTTGDIIVGTNISGNESKAFRVFNYGNAWYLDYGSGEGGNRISGGTCSNNTVYDIEIGNRYIKNLSTGTNIISGNSVGTFSHNDMNIGIFASTDYHTAPSKGKIYYLKVYSGASLVVDLIPVIRNSDNVVCMYDKVSNQFFTNQGTGTFIAGTIGG